ncbi:phospholipase A [Utexia brackfieldae]|uniref:phospholipase A n=1 Tax=Utexia brackfieldae TaxID=3074108 RepID=UPI00370D905C
MQLACYCSPKTAGLSLALLTCMAMTPAQASEVASHDRPDSIIARLLEKNTGHYFMLYPYESNYVIQTYTSNINRQSIHSYSWSEHARKDETKFQISLGFPIYRGIFGENSLLGASYTQRSWWQSLNASQSSPFRETNYEPQLFVGFTTDYQLLGWTIKDVEMGFNHQSNGRPEQTSRSWNRLYARSMATYNNFTLDLKLWYRIPESAKNDDNPDMTRYMGYYRLLMGYQWDNNTFTAQTHYNWQSGYGNVELGWSYPINDAIRLYAQLFSGYGESMIDYNYKQTRFGLGVMLNDLF